MSILTKLGRVGQHRIAIDVVPTITAGAYSAGDALGGRLEFNGASHGAGESGVVEAVRIVDRAAQGMDTDLILFDQAFTATADNAAFDPSDADLENMVGQISLLNTENYIAYTDNGVKYISGLTVPFITVGDDVLYGQLVTQGTPTYAAITDIRVRLYCRRD